MSAQLTSFLLPATEPAPFLNQTLRTLVAQTVDAWELILVVDGPGRTIEAVATSLVPAKKLRVCRLPERGGIAHALNIGLRAVRGEVVARIDADDLCHPNRLERQLDHLTRHPEVAVLGTAAALIDELGSLVGRRAVKAGVDVRRPLVARNQLVHSSVVFRTAAVLECGGYDPECHLREDYDLWLRVARHAVVANLDDDLVSYRISPGQISRGRPTPAALDAVWVSQGRLAASLGLSRVATLQHQVAWRVAQTPAAQQLLARRIQAETGPGT